VTEDGQAAGDLGVAGFAEYTDPRLVALYDTVCPFTEDRQYYVDLAAEHAATSVVDLGCGTGLVACELVRPGRRVVGVDPSSAMLAVARLRRGGDRVEWIEGDARAAEGKSADLVIMTGHVAQLIVDDNAWEATLGALWRALRPGGHLAFESRDPRLLQYAAGQDFMHRRHFSDAAAGQFDMWQEVVGIEGDVVRSELHYVLADGEELASENELRFRTEVELRAAVEGAGFRVERVLGDWHGRPVGPTTTELVFLAQRP